MRNLLMIVISLLALRSSADVAPPKYELDGQTLKTAAVKFEPSSDKLKPESEPVLAHVAAYVGDKPYVSLLRIEVHSDAQGSSAYNQTMSEKRALAVAKALVSRGVDCKRLIAVGFGETKPIADNRTAEGRAQNRRTVFVNAALRGRPIGGLPVDGGGKVAGDACH
jgi:OOP family OmpA-OmpF porin